MNGAVLTVGAFGAAVAGELLLARAPAAPSIPHVEGGDAAYAVLLTRLHTRHPHADGAVEAMRDEFTRLRSQWGTMRIPGSFRETITAPLGAWLTVCDWWRLLAHAVSGAAVLVQHAGPAITRAAAEFERFVDNGTGLRLKVSFFGADTLDVDAGEECEQALAALAVALDEAKDAFAPAHPDDRSYYDFVEERAVALGSGALDVGLTVAGAARELVSWPLGIAQDAVTAIGGEAAAAATKAIIKPLGAALVLGLVGYYVWRKTVGPVPGVPG